MARSSYAPRADYTGNNTLATYSFSFLIQDLTQIRVKIFSSTGTQLLDLRGDDPSLTIVYDAWNGGGTVTLPAVLASGNRLILLLAPDLPNQPYAFRQKSVFTQEYIERAFDWVVGQTQRLSYRVKRATLMSDFDDTSLFDPKWPPGLPGTVSKIPITSSDGTGWAPIASWMSVPNFYALAVSAVQQALIALGSGGSLSLPTDGKYGGAGSGTSGTAGSITGNDAGMTVNDAFDHVENILEKLAPAKPTALSASTLAITGSYAAKRSGTGVSYTTVIDSTTPVVAASAAFSDGDTGTLSAEIDSVQVGSRPLTTGSDVGTYSQLQITADADPYVGQAGKAGFWKALNAQINATVLALGVHLAALKHTVTGNASLTFGVDDPGVTTVAFGTIVGAGGTTYISGVPSLSVGATISVGITVSNAVRTFYNPTKVATTSSTATGSVDTASPGATPNSGDALTSTPALTVLTNKYTEAVTVTSNGFNSKGVAGTTATTSPSIRVDTISSESRVSSSTGQYPASGYGSAWVSTDLLSANKELQMLGGLYQYPPLTNYSGNLPTAGPNYSGLTADSYASMRWVTFNLGAKTAVSSVTLNLLGGVNLGSTALISSFAMYVRVDGATPTTGWVDANAAYPGTGNPTANGDAALDVGSSTVASRRVTFGSSPKTGNVIVRIGIPSGSTKQFSGISIV